MHDIDETQPDPSTAKPSRVDEKPINRSIYNFGLLSRQHVIGIGAVVLFYILAI